jgi:adenylate cyclase
MSVTRGASSHETGIDERWRRILSGEDRLLARGRTLFRGIPSAPRCKLCNAPSAGPGGAVMRRLGFAPWRKNPMFCQSCHKTLARLAVGGAELEISILFADVRGSTTIAEGIRPTAYRTLMDRYYRVAFQAIVEADGLVDSFSGDGVLALFIPVWAGGAHAARAILAAQEILRATGNDGQHPWLPVGAGIHTGVAFVGVVSNSDVADDLTALGDAVNTASRLSGSAAAGEILVSTEAATAAGLSGERLERRSLDLKGKAAPVDVVVLKQQGDREGDILLAKDGKD